MTNETIKLFQINQNFNPERVKKKQFCQIRKTREKNFCSKKISHTKQFLANK